MNGLDIKPCEAEPREGPFKMISVGMICENKGALELVRTAYLLKKDGFDCVWDIVGSWESNEFKEEMLNLVDELGVQQEIRFLGVLKGNEKWQAYANSDAFAFLSHHPTETFGLVLIEAMGMSLPIVTTNWRGIPNVVKNSEAATLCEIKSPTEFANAIKEFILDSKRHAEMKKNASNHYKLHYTQSRFVANMEKIFKSII